MKIWKLKIEGKLTKNSEGQLGTSERGITVLPLALINEMLYTLYLSSFIYFVRTTSHVNSLPLGHHTLGIECKGVLSTGVDRMLVGNRVGAGRTRSTISSFAPI